MAKVTWKGDPGDESCKEVTHKGKTFKKGESVDVDDEAALEKLKGNPYFEVAGGPTHDEPKNPKPGRNPTLGHKGE